MTVTPPRKRKAISFFKTNGCKNSTGFDMTLIRMSSFANHTEKRTSEGTPNALAVGAKGFRHWALIKLHLTISQSEGVYIFCFEINSKTKILLICCFKSVCVCMCVCAIKFFDWGENMP